MFKNNKNIKKKKEDRMDMRLNSIQKSQLVVQWVIKTYTSAERKEKLSIDIDMYK